MTNRLARAGLAGTVVGLLVFGVGGRIAMRLVALLIHQTTHFGVGASAGIILIGGILGTLSGALYGLLLGKRWPNNPNTKGLLYGTCLFGVLVMLQTPEIREEVRAARAFWWAIIPLFWAVCVIYSLILARQLAPSHSSTPGSTR